MARLDLGFDDGNGQTTLGVTGDILFELGLKYSAGRDVDVDLITAHKWFNLAALKGHDGAKAYRSEIAVELTKPEVAKAQRMAREWLRAA